uniref:Uncharacterized protein n=1 Tax=viral metagenome TaxID=1070528 RepID=A0A6M3IXD5_9ZZZZ
MDSTALTTMDKTTMLARINQAKFPQDLTPVDKDLLAVAAITYGFDPIMKEISIYQGNPFISIDGRYRKAQESGLLDGVETRPANKQEREDWSIPVEDYFFRSEVFVKGAGRPFVGWGRVFAKEALPGSRNDPKSTFKPIQSNPQRMAEKRAEAQALRKAFHIPLPSIEDIGLPEYDIDSTAIEVNKDTGEIIDKPKAIEAKATPQKVAPAKKQEPAVTPPQSTPAVKQESPQEYTATEQEPQPLIDMDWLKESLQSLNWNTCGKYLMDNYGVTGNKVSEMVKQMTSEQAVEFTKEVQDRLNML